ncbi:transcription factor GTE4-like [Impatiens glandulifera]|uniref:transcription factor GTE4-like n=1 Tax=Impatiens glandulifera TaxID=253017 RepID=UPI001FB18F0B|nr:transcription factor GTE4-like [Impatiens glandulifera]
MAWGTTCADKSRANHRWGDTSKVYTRKKLKKGVTNDSPSVVTEVVTDNDPPTISEPQTAIPSGGDDIASSVANLDSQDDIVGEEDNGNHEPHHSSHAEGSEEDKYCQQLQTPSLVNACSDNSSSLNQPPEAPISNGILGPLDGNDKPLVSRVDNRVRINFETIYPKDDVRLLRRKLLGELDQVRSLVKRFEEKEIELTGLSIDGYNGSEYPDNGVVSGRALLRVNSEFGSAAHRNSRPLRQLSVSVTNNSHVINEFVEKEKRTPKANQYYHNSEFLLGKDRLPSESNRKSKSSGGKKHGRQTNFGFNVEGHTNQALKSCNNLLARLLKHKHGWVFEKPVDAKALGLHDYHDIIKHPMDLGTIKSRLARSWYKSPREFAEDVRLTFSNAMTYNPKGQDVHIMAEEVSKVFEEKYADIEAENNHLHWRYQLVNETGFPTPTSRKVQPLPAPPSLPIRTFDRSESMPSMPFLKRSGSMCRTPAPKRPKAKDPNKRDMTYEEKQKLSTKLQGLPPDKLDSIVQIIKKRNTELCQHDDEIEVDIDTVDAETLWELDRFVTNYKKNLSKHKRRAELATQAKAMGVNAAKNKVFSPRADMDNTNETNIVAVPQSQGDNVSSSSSSSSDSGSSSDSDSDSSSGCSSDQGNH